jgi:hypothetical protein
MESLPYISKIPCSLLQGASIEPEVCWGQNTPPTISSIWIVWLILNVLFQVLNQSLDPFFVNEKRGMHTPSPPSSKQSPRLNK